MLICAQLVASEHKTYKEKCWDAVKEKDRQRDSQITQVVVQKYIEAYKMG